jgi:hypothetical protein
MKSYVWIGILVAILLLNTVQEGFANNSMNLFANKMKPTCQSSYSSDSGFICLTEQQKHILHTRGGNRTLDADWP